ncbi:MAG TPA: FAD-binding oxidoreductase [Candidatus Eisenbacteria bacterium]|nr:FAD-binding oxidoreductase [Candidatus Eisenbacteria bacterium]
MSLERALADAVGGDHVLTDPGLCAAYETDWTRRFTGRARAVVRPADTDQVAAVVRACAEHGAPLVPQGGNTGLVGGSVPRGDGAQVLLSTRRLAGVDVDKATREVVASSGATIAAVQDAARAAGLAYGVDLASRDSATVGGTVATNAGGIRVVRHGTTRAQVRGLEAVLADGSVVSRLHGPPQDSAGYDLAGLLTGSEGTLAVVTAARLRLVPRPGPGWVVLVGAPTVATAVELLPADGVRAAELMLAPGVDLVRRVAGLPRPLGCDWPVYLLLETDEPPELPEGVDAAVDERLWAYRERHTEAVSTLGVPHKLDVSVPLGRVAALVDALPAAVSPYDVFVFGHLAMGNLHVNVVGPEADDETVDEQVFRLVADLGGSIAAEHGVGLAKARWLPLTRTPAEIDAMRRIKRAFDPHGLLNPGVLLP